MLIKFIKYALCCLVLILLLPPSLAEICGGIGECPVNHDCVGATCLLRCAQIEDCPPGHYCDGSYCRQSDNTCQSHDDCLESWYCSKSGYVCAPGNRCVSSCLTQAINLGTGCFDAPDGCFVEGGECLKGGCNLRDCSSDIDCSSREICSGGFCVTADEDEDGFYLPHVGREPVDCDDDSNLCTVGCDPSDTDNYINVDNDPTADCHDICIDEDGDGFCSPDSVKVYDDFTESFQPSASPADPPFYNSLDNLGFERIVDVIGFFHISDFEYVHRQFGWTDMDRTWDQLSDFMTNQLYAEFPAFDDCDDSNPNINGTAIEVCNRVDDNCDGRVDECVEGDDFECVFDYPSVDVSKCRLMDADLDGFKNESFGCYDCYDCNDDGEDSDGDGFANGYFVNPDADDCVGGENCLAETCASVDGYCSVGPALDGDENCNGVPDDGADDDEDGVPNEFEDPGCEEQGFVWGNSWTINPATGCLWNLRGWII